MFCVEKFWPKNPGNSVWCLNSFWLICSRIPSKQNLDPTQNLLKKPVASKLLWESWSSFLGCRGIHRSRSFSFVFRQHVLFFLPFCISDNSYLDYWVAYANSMQLWEKSYRTKQVTISRSQQQSISSSEVFQLQQNSVLHWRQLLMWTCRVIDSENKG